MESQKVNELKDLLLDLVKTSCAYDAYKETSEQAQKEEDEAMQRLNETQKAVDAALQELRSSSPVGSTWCNGLKSKIKEEVDG